MNIDHKLKAHLLVLLADNSYVNTLIDAADNLPYMDYCRLLAVVWWNL